MAGRVNGISGRMKAEFICYIDCRGDSSLTNDFLDLNIWGKAVYRYVIETVLNSNAFDRVIVVTDLPKIEKALINEKKVTIESNFIFPHYDSIVCIISGRAVMIKSTTIKKACSIFTSGVMYSTEVREEFNYLLPHSLKSFLCGYESNPKNVFAFYRIRDGEIKEHPITEFQLNSDEAVVINTVNDFELSIVLKKKEENKKLLYQSILARIEEKKEIFSSAVDCPSICLVGHSQIDFWKAEDIAGYKVKNCGIAGISSFEYTEFILSKEMLDCSSDIFVVMHGTNDIVKDVEIDEIIRSIQKTICYIRKRNDKALVYFLSCMHTNGRLDRDNRKIDELNTRLKEELKNDIRWIDTKFMDDEFCELEIRNTIDGLHLSDQGYKILQDYLETRLFEDMHNEI